MVGKLAPNSTHFTRGLVKYVPGRGYFRVVPSQNGDIFVTSPPPPQSLNEGPPDISNVVRSVARYCSTPKAIHCKSALGILAYITGTSGFGITYQRGTLEGIFF